MTIMYIHGYGSNGNATKGQLLRKKYPQHNVVSPTFDYDHSTPWQIQDLIRETVEQEKVSAIVGSSFGGYHTLCAMSFFRGCVWAINPVHDVESAIRHIILSGNQASQQAQSFLDMYKDFNSKVFMQQSLHNQHLPQSDNIPLNFALSTDDELLGDHRPLLDLFPRHDRIVWMDNCGHRFMRFEELNLSL